MSGLITACGTVPGTIPNDYNQTDAGAVVLWLGAEAGTSFAVYTLLFRPKQVFGYSTKSVPEGRFIYQPPERLLKGYKYDTDKGRIIISGLPAGEYEIFNYSIYDSGYISAEYSSRIPLTIPFEVKVATTTYLGNYLGNRNAVFSVKNNESVDMRLAWSKDNSVFKDVINATPATLGVNQAQLRR